MAGGGSYVLRASLFERKEGGEFVRYKRGDVVKLSADEAERLTVAGSVEKPGESERREQERLSAEAARLQGEADRLEALAKGDEPPALAPVTGQPFEGYGDLNVEQVLNRLAGMSPDEVAAVQAYEAGSSRASKQIAAFESAPSS